MVRQVNFSLVGQGQQLEVWLKSVCGSGRALELSSVFSWRAPAPPFVIVRLLIVY